MADEVIDRLSIEIEGDSKKYNTSIDAAVAKTKAMQVQQKKLVEDLSKNAEAQKKTAVSIENNSKSLAKNATAIQNAITKYGAESSEVSKLNERKEKLTKTSENLTKRVEALSNKEQALGSQLSSINKCLDGQQKELSETASQAKKTESSMSGLKSSMRGFMNVIATAATGYAGKKFLEATIGGLAEFEQYETSFAVMLGDMGKAKAMMSDLQEFATKTPFEMTDVTKAGTLLMNYGVEAEKLIPTMRQLGDLSQGQAEKLDRVSLAYGQMLAKGKVTGEELRQMTEAGVPLTQALATSIGTSTAELSKMIEKGQVGIPQLNKAIEDLTTGNGKFAGMMEKQSKTLVGMWSTTKDELAAVGREIGEEAFVEVKDGLSDMLKDINTMRASGELSNLAKDLGSMLSLLSKAFMGVTKCVVENKEVVGGLVAAYGTFKIVQQVAVMQKLFTTAVNASTVAQKAMNVVAYANPYVALAGALMAGVGTFVMFSSSANESKERLKELNEELENFETTSIEGATSRLAELKVASEQTIPKIEELGNKSSRTAGEKELLKRYIENLNTVMGYEAASIDEVTGKLSMNTDEIYKNIEALESKAKADAIKSKIQEEYSKSIEDMIELEKLKKEKIKVQAVLEESEARQKKDGNSVMLNEVFYNQKNVKKADKKIKDQEAIIQKSTDLIETYSSFCDTFEEKSVIATNGMESFWKSFDSSQMTEFASDLKSTSDSINTLTNAQKEYDTDNKLSISTLESLAKAYPELSDSINEYSLGLIDIKDLVGQFPDLYENEKKAFVDSARAKLVGSEAFYKQSILSQSSLVGIYKSNHRIDLNNFKTLAEAKNFVETNLINLLGDKWAEYYKSVGGNATFTAQAMQEQVDALKTAKNSLSVSNDKFASSEIDKQIADLERIMSLMKPMQDLEKFEMNVDFSSVENNFDNMMKSTESKAKTGAKKVEDILKSTYEEQLKIAQDYLKQRKTQIDDEYKHKLKKINEGFDADKKVLDNWYNREKEKVQSSIDAIDELINAKRKAREDEKLDDNISFAQKRIQTLQTQITYARDPWEKEEFEKELDRQQEELKDLNIQKEVSELESQKQLHENDLSNLEERYKAESELIQKRKDEQLTAIEDAKNATLESLETTFTQFSDNLASTYGYVNNETLAIGQRFANATNGALENGFTAVANKSKNVMDSMVAQVQEKINQMNSMLNRLSERYTESQSGGNYRYDNNDYRQDRRSMTVTNHITRGLTEGQVERMMKRQAEDFLYKRR